MNWQAIQFKVLLCKFKPKNLVTAKLHFSGVSCLSIEFLSMQMNSTILDCSWRWKSLCCFPWCSHTWTSATPPFSSVWLAKRDWLEIESPVYPSAPSHSQEPLQVDVWITEFDFFSCYKGAVTPLQANSNCLSFSPFQRGYSLGCAIGINPLHCPH